MPKRPAPPIAVMSSHGIASFSSISFSCGASVSSTNLRTEVWRSLSSSGSSRSTFRVLQDHSQSLRHALRAQLFGAPDDDLDGAHVRAVQTVRAVDRVFERPRRVPYLADAHLDVELLVESQRSAVLEMRLADREVDAAVEEVLAVVDAEVTQVRDAADLGVQKVVRVIDALLHVRLAKTHALTVREGERLHARQVTGLARSLLALPAWLYDTMTIPPNALSGSSASSICTTARR